MSLFFGVSFVFTAVSVCNLFFPRYYTRKTRFLWHRRDDVVKHLYKIWYHEKRKTRYYEAQKNSEHGGKHRGPFFQKQIFGSEFKLFRNIVWRRKNVFVLFFEPFPRPSALRRNGPHDAAVNGAVPYCRNDERIFRKRRLRKLYGALLFCPYSKKGSFLFVFVLKRAYEFLFVFWKKSFR